MNQKTNNRMQMLTAMAIFIAAVFIWGIVQWQATGVKEPTVQKALATQKKVNNVSDKKVNIEALTKILLQEINYETNRIVAERFQSSFIYGRRNIFR